MELEACDNLWMFAAFLLFLNSGRLFLIHATVISTCILYVHFYLTFTKTLTSGWLLPSISFDFALVMNNKTKSGKVHFVVVVGHIKKKLPFVERNTIFKANIINS